MPFMDAELEQDFGSDQASGCLTWRWGMGVGAGGGGRKRKAASLEKGIRLASAGSEHDSGACLTPH